MADDDRPATIRRLAGYAFAGREPRARLRALSALRLELDRLEGELAAEALQAGLTWSQIGSALGVSKQAAHRRHRHGASVSGRPANSRGRAGRSPGTTGASSCAPGSIRAVPPTLSRETQMAVRFAQVEAARLSDREVKLDHLLVSLLRFRQSELARSVLRGDVDVAEARELLRSGQGEHSGAPDSAAQGQREAAC